MSQSQDGTQHGSLLIYLRGNMADTENMQDTSIQKNSKIIVNVEEALPDILVVTYEYGSKIFQGVLLDSTKRNLPYGVTSLNPIYTNDKPEGVDRLYSANQRFTYQEGVSTVTKDFTQKRAVRLPTRYKNTKMTVRLRPRQVLCTKCRGICTENSENVDASRKRKIPEEEPSRPTPQKRTTAPVTRSSRPLSSDSQCNEQHQQILKQRMCLRLTPIVLAAEDAIKEESSKPEENSPECEERVNPKLEFKPPPPTIRKAGKGKKMVLRKKKSVGSMEDQWDESAFEEKGANGTGVSATGGDLSNSTRTIKISFGREGEGTVLKIPAKIEHLDTPSDPSEDSVPLKARTKGATSKAARRALKKAKKEARRKILLGSGGSPCYALGSASPRYTLAGNGSPRYMIGTNASPRHTLGGNSPRYAVTATMPNYDNFPRRHKHKVKHKKKHREDRHSQRDTENESTDPAIQEESYTEIKERCLKQKLSINLKRLNASAYTSKTCENNSSADEPIKTEPEEGSEYSTDEQNENVPDFPAQPITMHITAKMVETAVLSEFSIGDIVWGKIQGFPWWPGKVLSMTEAWPDAPAQAYVAWYGSTTSSLMPCNKLSPFLENFEIRYNKKKKGPYKKAIEEATCEAGLTFPAPPSISVPVTIPPVLVATPALDEPLILTPATVPDVLQGSETSAIAVTTVGSAATTAEVVSAPLVQVALASPREINVVS